MVVIDRQIRVIGPLLARVGIQKLLGKALEHDDLRRRPEADLPVEEVRLNHGQGVLGFPLAVADDPDDAVLFDGDVNTPLALGVPEQVSNFPFGHLPLPRTSARSLRGPAPES